MRAMSTNEFTDWRAFYNLERAEAERQRREAERKAKTRRKR